jgi:hypothetical protein
MPKYQGLAAFKITGLAAFQITGLAAFQITPCSMPKYQAFQHDQVLGLATGPSTADHTTCPSTIGLATGPSDRPCSRPK